MIGLLLAGEAAYPNDKRSSNTLSLTQKQYLIGPCTVYLQPHAFKLVTEGKSYLIAKSPDWKLVFFNPTTKEGCSIPYERFLKFGLDGMEDKTPNTVRNWPTVKLSSDTVVGLSCTHYVLPFLNRSHEAVSISRGKTGDYWVLDANNPNASREASKIMQKLSGLPAIDGFPLTATLTEPRKARKVEPLEMPDMARKRLQTTDSSLVSCNNNFFNYPTIGKRLGDPMQVLYSAKQKKDINEWAEEFGMNKD